MKAKTPAPGQMTIYDWMPTLQPEPKVGEFVTKHGQVICHIMRPSCIGHKVVFDCSTQSMECYRVGILEKVLNDSYWHRDAYGQYKIVECDRSVIYTGQKQRISILHMPGREIYECLP